MTEYIYITFTFMSARFESHPRITFYNFSLRVFRVGYSQVKRRDGRLRVSIRVV